MDLSTYTLYKKVPSYNGAPKAIEAIYRVLRSTYVPVVRKVQKKCGQMSGHYHVMVAL